MPTMAFSHSLGLMTTLLPFGFKKTSPHYSISLKCSKEMAHLKFTLNFAISQASLKCRITAFLERIPQPSPGWGRVELGFCTGTVRSGTVPPDTVVQTGNRPSLYLYFPKNSQSFGEFRDRFIFPSVD